MKKGLDPEALTGKYPPKIRMYSKYERRTDTRTYEDRRKLYEGVSIFDYLKHFYTLMIILIEFPFNWIIGYHTLAQDLVKM